MRRHPVVVTSLLGLFTIVAWVALWGRPMTSDEGGFLLIAEQWRPGSSLYGDHWVDRPPLLMWIFDLADALGGLTALRVIGLVSALATIALAGALGPAVARVGGLDARTRLVFVPAVAATACVASPLFGIPQVDGELLSLPFSMAAILCLVRALPAADHPVGPRPGHPWTWWVLAGALSTCAAMVKQNMIDGFVVGLVLVVWLGFRDGRRTAILGAGALAAGGIAAGALLIASAAARGTPVAGLWEAIVTFRIEASGIIAEESGRETSARALRTAAAGLGSGAVALGAAIVWSWLHRVGRSQPASAPGPRVLPIRIAAGVLVVWEVIAIVAGGSYWLHYLLGLVPGLSLAAATVRLRAHPSSRAVALALGWLGAATAATVVVSALDPPKATEEGAVDYLAEHAMDGDSGVVAFGTPSILRRVGLDSPYEELWSLPVRVRDPELRRFTSVLVSPDRPTWVISHGEDLDTWGIDGSAGQQALEEHYRKVADEGSYVVWLARGLTR